MRLRIPSVSRNVWLAVGLVVLVGVAWLTQAAWLPAARNAWASLAKPTPATEAHADHDEADAC